MAMVSVSCNELVRPDSDRVVMARAEERYAKRMEEREKQAPKKDEPEPADQA